MRYVLSQAVHDALEIRSEHAWTTVDVQDAAVALSPVVRRLQMSRSQLLKFTPLSMIGVVMDVMARDSSSRHPSWWKEEANIYILKESSSLRGTAKRKADDFVDLINYAVKMLQDAIIEVRGGVTMTTFSKMVDYFETYLALLGEGTQRHIFYQNDRDIQLLCQATKRLYQPLGWMTKCIFLAQEKAAPHDPGYDDEFSILCYTETVESAQPSRKKKRGGRVGQVTEEEKRGFAMNVTAGNAILLDVVYMISSIGGPLI